MSKVIIVSKTRMAEGRVCVGGVDIERKRSVRLMKADGKHELLSECPYEIWDVWDADYVPSNQRPAPHVEDVNVINRNKRDVLEKELRSPTEFAKLLRQSNMPVFTGGLLNCFDGKLKCNKNGKLYINAEDAPSYSTCFWLNDISLRRKDFMNNILYNYDDGIRPWGYSTKYVGLSDAIDVVPAGSIIRLSLAHWWKPDGSDDEERCYLQLSGWYL